MSNSKKHGILSVILLIIGAMTVGGLGNAAFMYQKIYWIPAVINLIFYGYLVIREFKAQWKDEEVGAVSEKQRDPKTGRYIKSDGGKAK